MDITIVAETNWTDRNLQARPAKKISKHYKQAVKNKIENVAKGKEENGVKRLWLLWE